MGNLKFNSRFSHFWSRKLAGGGQHEQQFYLRIRCFWKILKNTQFRSRISYIQVWICASQIANKNRRPRNRPPKNTICILIEFIVLNYHFLFCRLSFQRQLFTKPTQTQNKYDTVLCIQMSIRCACDGTSIFSTDKNFLLDSGETCVQNDIIFIWMIFMAVWGAHSQVSQGAYPSHSNMSNIRWGMFRVQRKVFVGDSTFVFNVRHR